MSIMDWERDPIIFCEREDCGFMTGIVHEAMEHALETGHRVTGPGRLEGTILTVSITKDEDNDES